MRTGRHVAALALALSGCAADRETGGPGPLVASSRPAAPAEAASGRERDSSWRKPRYIPLREALRMLRPHVDVPVVLPRDASVGLPNLRGWLADPKYLEWATVDGIRAGGLTIRKGRRILLLSYGLASFDGCGDRSTATETRVLGRPALVSDAEEYRWSHVLWPVTKKGSTGRYGISGTWDAPEMIRLAESMELARLRAVDHARGC